MHLFNCMLCTKNAYKNSGICSKERVLEKVRKKKEKGKVNEQIGACFAYKGRYRYRATL